MLTKEQTDGAYLCDVILIHDHTRKKIIKGKGGLYLRHLFITAFMMRINFQNANNLTNLFIYFVHF